MKWVPILFLCVGLFFWSNAYSEPPERAVIPSLVSSLKIEETLLRFCGESVPTQVQGVRERLEKELLLSLWNRPQVILWLKRSGRYLPHIEKMLKKNGLPDDLKYVAIAESALRPHAVSRRGAAGFWQFTPGTGRKYGLVVNSRIDERRNLFASTRAAIRCFKALRKKFGSWPLALAAYNMGEDGLTAEMLEQDTSSYYRLYLPIETQRFLFRVLSVKLIFTDPARFGFRLRGDDYYPPMRFDEVQVDCPQEIPIRILAKAAGTHFKVIKDLNPEIRGHYLAEGRHQLLIPEGASAGFQVRYQRHVERFLGAQKERIYIVKEGDNLSSIAYRFDVPLAVLIIWNHLDLRRPIHPGDRLIIHPQSLEGKKREREGEGSRPIGNSSGKGH